MFLRLPVLMLDRLPCLYITSTGVAPALSKVYDGGVMDEYQEVIIDSESGDGSDSEVSSADDTVTVVYTEQLDQIRIVSEVQLSVSLFCVGLLLVFLAITAWNRYL